MSENKPQIIAIACDGETSFIYDDGLSPLLSEGRASVTRASNVEPDGNGGWVADMSPSGHDVKLGPFKLRQEALDAERIWLEGNVL